MGHAVELAGAGISVAALRSATAAAAVCLQHRPEAVFSQWLTGIYRQVQQLSGRTVVSPDDGRRAILGIGNLFQPVRSGSVVGDFTNREMDEQAIRRGPVPVLDVGPNQDGVNRLQQNRSGTFHLNPPRSVQDVKRLSNRTGNAPAPVDAVVHFAAIPRILLRPDNETFRVNVIGTYNVIGAAMKLCIRKVVIASSETTYGVCFVEGDKEF